VITSADTSDNDGVASAILTSVPVNADAIVSAWIILNKNVIAVSQTVSIDGIEIVVTPSLKNAPLNATVPVQIEVIDGSGSPVPDAPLTLSGAMIGTVRTNAKGIYSVNLTSATQAVKKLTVTGLGATSSDSVKFWTTVPSGTGTPVRNLQLRLYSSRTQLKADNTDNAVITAILVDDNRNPAVGDTIKFACDLGVIDAFAIVDTAGRATAKLRSTAQNGNCTITAIASGKNLTASTIVLFSGVKISLVAEPKDLKTNEYSTIRANLKDASGNPIGSDTVSFTISGALGTFENGQKTSSLKLSPDGTATVRVTSSAAGTVTVRASAANSEDSAVINYTTNSLACTTSVSSLLVGGADSTQVTATLRNGSNQPLANQLIIFSTNVGTITKDSATTDANGRARTFLKSAAFADVATVQATASNGIAQATVRFIATKAFRIALTITPDNISVNGGEANLIATVTDTNNNMVTDALVNFRITKGPGGGETILKPVVVSKDGIATTILKSGTLPSAYRNCEVIATVGSLSATNKLTISGAPHIISISRPESDTVKVPNAGQMDESTFAFFIGAVVQDINGNPVADGTEVHFSAVVSGMKYCALQFSYWSGLNGVGEKKAILAYSPYDNPFEDINNDTTMTPGIDLTIDYINMIARRGDDVNGDGKMDYDPLIHDFFWDFNGNDVCDPDTGEPIFIDRTVTPPIIDSTIYADLNKNGRWDKSELKKDHNGNGTFDGPASGDFMFSEWEMRPQFDGRFDFSTNDFAVVIESSAPTKGGIAYAKLKYPRQFAQRLYVTLNAEANGIRDRDGERVLLPVVRE
jgi:protocatechuate 3,4-dioxygenase beta subunit